MSDSLWPHDVACQAPLSYMSPRVCSNSCPLSRWCYLTISFSAAIFSFCLQSFLALGCFLVNWLLASGGQSIGASASATVLPVNIQGWFPLELTGLISLQPKELSRVFSSTIIWKHQFLGAQPSLWTNSHRGLLIYMYRIFYYILLVEEEWVLNKEIVKASVTWNWYLYYTSPVTSMLFLNNMCSIVPQLALFK